MADDTADLALENETELDLGTGSDTFELPDDEGEDLDIEDGQEGEGDDQETEEELEDAEYDGKSYRLPKGLKDALLRQEDYTRKTQTVAEERRALEQQRARVAQQAQASEQELDARVAVRAIDKQIAAYENVDWRAWQQQDPSAASAGMMELNQLREQKARGEHFIQHHEQRRTAEAARDFEERIAETKTFAAKEIKGWTPDLDKQITNFAVAELGITPEFLRESINPLLYKTLHRAFVGDQAMKRAASVKAKPQTPPAKATTTVKAKNGAPPSGLDDRLSADEWLKRRNAQVAKQQSR